MAAIAGFSILTGHRSTPGPSASAAPGTDPGDGDTTSGGQGQVVDGVQCEDGEKLDYHVHAHLFILLDGRSQPVSAYVGIPGSPPLLPKCFYWLHTHDRTGLIHEEAPAQRDFTLGQFFDIWGQPLSATKVARLTVPAAGMKVFVDGQEYAGDPRGVVLKRHTQVVIELGRQAPPPTYDFGAS